MACWQGAGSSARYVIYALCVRVCAEWLQTCLTLCSPVDCSPPGSSVHGASPDKNTGVGCRALLQGIFLTQGLNLHLFYLLHWQVGSLPVMPLGKRLFMLYFNLYTSALWLLLSLTWGWKEALYLDQEFSPWFQNHFLSPRPRKRHKWRVKRMQVTEVDCRETAQLAPGTWKTKEESVSSFLLLAVGSCLFDIRISGSMKLTVSS